MIEQENDLIISKNSFSIRLSASWLEYLKDFGLTSADFARLADRLAKSSVDILVDIIQEKNEKSKV